MRTFEAERPRQRGTVVRTRPPTAGQLVLHFLRFTSAGEVADAVGNFGGIGAMLTNLAQITELSIVQIAETASRYEKARSAARLHLTRKRGDMDTI